MDRIFTQLDRLDSKMDEMAKILTENTMLLREYKGRQDEHTKWMGDTEVRVDDLEGHFTGLKGFLTIGGWLVGAVATLLTGFHYVYGFLSR